MNPLIRTSTRLALFSTVLAATTLTPVSQAQFKLPNLGNLGNVKPPSVTPPSLSKPATPNLGNVFQPSSTPMTGTTGRQPTTGTTTTTNKPILNYDVASTTAKPLGTTAKPTVTGDNGKPLGTTAKPTTTEVRRPGTNTENVSIRPNNNGTLPNGTQNWRPNRPVVTIVPVVVGGGPGYVPTGGNTLVTPTTTTPLVTTPLTTTPLTSASPLTQPQTGVPRNNLGGAVVKAPGNKSISVKPAPLGLTDDVTAQADKAVNNQLDDMAGRFQPPLITPDQADAIVSSVPDATKANNLRDKLLNGTPSQVYQAAKDAGFSDAKAKALKNNATVTGAFNDYKQSVMNGASADVTAQKAGALKQAMKDTGASQASQDKLQKSLDQTATLAALKQNINGGTTTASGGSAGAAAGGWVYFVNMPGVPAGDVYFVDAGSGTLVTGTGDEGTLSVSTATPTPDLTTAPPPPPAGGELVLYNPGATKGLINFSVDGQPFKLDAGYVQRVPGNGPFTIEFDKGGTTTRYALEPRNYEFSREQQRWDVFAKNYKATIDNTTNRGDFSFILDDQIATIPAGQRVEVKAQTPIVILFDRGDGKEPARKDLSGSYEVRINPQTRLLDLFRQGETVARN